MACVGPNWRVRSATTNRQRGTPSGRRSRHGQRHSSRRTPWRKAEALAERGEPRAATGPLREGHETPAHRSLASGRPDRGLGRALRINISPPALDQTHAPKPAPLAHADPFGLSKREREVLPLVAKGYTNRRIAETLFVSESTAGVHVSHILGKLGVESRTEAAAVAVRLGLDRAPRIVSPLYIGRTSDAGETSSATLPTGRLSATYSRSNRTANRGRRRTTPPPRRWPDSRGVVLGGCAGGAWEGASMPKNSTVADLKHCRQLCKGKILGCLDDCETAFVAGGGTVTVQDGGKVFVDKDGGKVFIADPK